MVGKNAGLLMSMMLNRCRGKCCPLKGEEVCYSVDHRLTLTLLVLLVLAAYDKELSSSSNTGATVTEFLDRRSYFHGTDHSHHGQSVDEGLLLLLEQAKHRAGLLE